MYNFAIRCFFSLQKEIQKDLSYHIGGFLGCLGSKESLSYNEINMVLENVFLLLDFTSIFCKVLYQSCNIYIVKAAVYVHMMDICFDKINQVTQHSLVILLYYFILK